MYEGRKEGRKEDLKVCITWSNWQGPCAWQLYWKSGRLLCFLNVFFSLCSLCMLTWSCKSPPVQQQWYIHSGILVEVGFGVKSDMRIKDCLPNLVWFLCSQYLSINLIMNWNSPQKKPHEVAIWGVTSVYNLKWLWREDEKFKVSVITTHW